MIVKESTVASTILATNDYENSPPMEMMEFQSNNKPTFEGMTRMLRDPGWRHIGLGKRAGPRSLTSGKTWAMIGLGR